VPLEKKANSQVATYFLHCETLKPLNKKGFKLSGKPCCRVKLDCLARIQVLLDFKEFFQDALEKLANNQVQPKYSILNH
jgi:hypothetical protein